MLLKEFIAIHFGGNNAAFARAISADRQQVRKWIADGWIVKDRRLYSFRREIPIEAFENYEKTKSCYDDCQENYCKGGEQKQWGREQS
ncbi:hypothetical protein ACP3BQ_005250 [Klebsiella pneumoniae]